MAFPFLSSEQSWLPVLSGFHFGHGQVWSPIRSGLRLGPGLVWSPVEAGFRLDSGSGFQLGGSVRFASVRFVWSGWLWFGPVRLSEAKHPV